MVATEATVVATSYKIPYQIDNLSTIPIGKPLPNLQTYILDENLQPVPIGITGELYIGGAGFARGYLNNSELTAEKFIPNPFLPVRANRVRPYRMENYTKQETKHVISPAVTLNF